MNERSYYFPEHTLKIIEGIGIDEACGCIINSEFDENGVFNPYRRDYSVDFQKAQEEHIAAFQTYARKLNADEQSEIGRILRNGSGSDIALLGHEHDHEDRLFTVVKQLGKTSLQEEDILTFSGAGSLSFIEAGYASLFKGYKKIGVKSQLELMVIAGAYLAEKTFRNADNMQGPSFVSGDNDSLVTRTIITGDVHGDFRLIQEEASKKGCIIGSTGTTYDFSPILFKGVAAYHSSEPGIVSAICAHVFLQNIPDFQKHEIFQNALQSSRSRIDHGSNYFGDFGDERDVRENCLLNLESLALAPLDKRSLYLPALSGNDDILLDIRSEGECISLQNIRFSSREVLSGPIIFKLNHIPKLLKAFANIGLTASRTSQSTITEVIQTYLDVLNLQRNSNDTLTEIIAKNLNK